jgi:hypothetical protein
LRYKILYRKGRENIIADALSRKNSCEISTKDIGTLKAITNVLPAWYEDVYASYEKDCKLQTIILSKLTGATGNPTILIKRESCDTMAG